MLCICIKIYDPCKRKTRKMESALKICENFFFIVEKFKNLIYVKVSSRFVQFVYVFFAYRRSSLHSCCARKRERVKFYGNPRADIRPAHPFTPQSYAGTRDYVYHGCIGILIADSQKRVMFTWKASVFNGHARPRC